MQYVTRLDDISVLPLSVRLSNCLRRTNIHTIGGMIDYPQNNDWASIRNMGAKSIEEVNRWIDLLNHGSSDEYCLVDQQTKAQAVPVVAVSNEEYEQDKAIEDLRLTVRAYNCLKNAGIEYVSQLLGKSVENLMAMKGMGKGSAEEVFAVVEKWLSKRTKYVLASEEAQTTEAGKDIRLSINLSETYHASQSSCLHEIMMVRSRYPEAQGETFYYRLYEVQCIRDAVKIWILALLERNKDEMTPKALSEQLPAHLENTTILEEILLELELDDQISCGEALIVRVYPSVMEYISSIEDDRAKDFLLGRLEGKTLEEIGEKYGITRERVRQVISKYQRRIHELGLRFREDKYADIFARYMISFEDFFLAFDEPESTYYYLDAFCTASAAEKKPLEEILEDQTVSVAMRKRAERAIYKQYVTIDGVRVKRNRTELSYHVIKTKCRDLTPFDDFLRYYEDVLEMFGLQDDSAFQIEYRTYENKLNMADYVLWNQWRSFRYYEIHHREYDDLLEGLNLAQYENCEISSLKLFRDNPELMQVYDVRDEYELHNLLKKICVSGELEINFHRMPTIEIGQANRDNQVLDVLLQYAPISIEDLAKAYEDTYGIKSATVMSNYLKNFDEFFYDGVYSIDAGNLPPEQYDRMQSVLNRTYYLISDIKRIYLREFPGADASQINPYTLKTLGFRVYSNYVIKNQYSGASAYFDEMLTGDDVVDGREFEKGLCYISAYNSELAKLKRERVITEYLPHQYINIRRLNACGITALMLNEYCDAVYRFADHRSFFTIASLRGEGFTHPLDDLGFDDWFYSSLLLEDREHFSCSRMGGARLFRKGKGSIDFEDMLRWIVETYQRMDVYDLCALLDERYGIVIQKEKLIAIVRNTDMYYDAIMEAVYIDYDTYFEEV